LKIDKKIGIKKETAVPPVFLLGWSARLLRKRRKKISQRMFKDTAAHSYNAPRLKYNSFFAMSKKSRGLIFVCSTFSIRISLIRDIDSRTSHFLTARLGCNGIEKKTPSVFHPQKIFRCGPIKPLNSSHNACKSVPRRRFIAFWVELKRPLCNNSANFKNGVIRVIDFFQVAKEFYKRR